MGWLRRIFTDGPTEADCLRLQVSGLRGQIAMGALRTAAGHAQLDQAFSEESARAFAALTKTPRHYTDCTHVRQRAPFYFLARMQGLVWCRDCKRYLAADSHAPVDAPLP